MNKSRRALLDKAAALLDEAKTLIDEVASDERDALDAMPESVQNGDKWQQADDHANNLSSALDDLDSLIEVVNEAKGE